MRARRAAATTCGATSCIVSRSSSENARRTSARYIDSTQYSPTFVEICDVHITCSILQRLQCARTASHPSKIGPSVAKLPVSPGCWNAHRATRSSCLTSSQLCISAGGHRSSRTSCPCGTPFWIVPMPMSPASNGISVFNVRSACCCSSRYASSVERS